MICSSQTRGIVLGLEERVWIWGRWRGGFVYDTNEGSGIAVANAMEYGVPIWQGTFWCILGGGESMKIELLYQPLVRLMHSEVMRAFNVL